MKIPCALLVVLSRIAAAAQPLEIPPSQYWDGNDGPWSTFFLRVGTPEQHVRVLASTASPQSMLVASPDGCSSSAFSGSSTPSNCATSRGALFDEAESSSWVDIGTYAINGDGVGLEANLGYDLNATWGLDSVGLGLNGPALENMTVAAFSPAEPMYLGVLGLNNQPVNFSTLGNTSNPSVLVTLKDQGHIPSISWSYTAGAQYRLKQVLGQLIFGGYDKSRFTENEFSFSMAEDVTRDLVVSLQSIHFSGGSQSTLLSDAIDMFIDSTDPNLWLPASACEAFERAFDISLDSTTGLYLINETHHNSLRDANPEVSFRLSDVAQGGDSVLITLPYEAFAKTAGPPLTSANNQRYFPLKRAESPAQYTLGRTFLQEAYLTADYERKTFSVSACVWNQGAQPDIVAIESPGSGGSGGGSGSGSGLSPGAIAGIVIGSLAGAALIFGVAAVIILRMRRKWLARGFRDVGRQPPSPKPETEEAGWWGRFVGGGPAAVLAEDPRGRYSGSGSLKPDSEPIGGSSTGNDDASPGMLSTPTPAGSSSTDGPSSRVSPAMAGAVAAGRLASVDEDPKARPELDGREVLGSDGARRSTAAPGVYELAGSGVGAGGHGQEHHGRERDDDEVSLPTDNGAGTGTWRAEDYESSPLSPRVSTMGADWDSHPVGLRPHSWQDR